MLGRQYSLCRISVVSKRFIGGVALSPSFMGTFSAVTGGPVSYRLVIASPSSCVRILTRGKTNCVYPRTRAVGASTFHVVGGVRTLKYGGNIILGPTAPLSCVERCVSHVSGLAVVAISPKFTKRPFVGRVLNGVERTGRLGRGCNCGFLVRVSNSYGREAFGRLCRTKTRIFVMNSSKLFSGSGSLGGT